MKFFLNFIYLNLFYLNLFYILLLCLNLYILRFINFLIFVSFNLNNISYNKINKIQQFIAVLNILTCLFKFLYGNLTINFHILIWNIDASMYSEIISVWWWNIKGVAGLWKVIASSAEPNLSILLWWGNIWKYYENMKIHNKTLL